MHYGRQPSSGIERWANMIMARLKMKQIIASAYRFGVCVRARSQSTWQRIFNFYYSLLWCFCRRNRRFLLRLVPAFLSMRPCSSFERRKPCNTVRFIQFSIFALAASAGKKRILVIWFYVSRAPIQDERAKRRSENAGARHLKSLFA